MSEPRRDLPVGSSVILSALIVVGAAFTLDQPDSPAPSLAVGGGSPSPETAPTPPAGRAPETDPDSDSDPKSFPEGPRSAFSASREGETLQDFARRVYGTDQAVGTLLGANRDVIRDPDAPLA